MGPVLEIALRTTVLGIVVVSLLPLWRHDAWWIRACDFPRVQIFVTGLLAGGIYVGFYGARHTIDKMTLGLLLLGLALQAYRIYPYTPLAPKQSLTVTKPNPASTISVLAANVLMHNRDAGRLLDLIQVRDPDLILTVETDAWWEERLRVLETEYPYTVKRPLENTYGMLLHSRLELLDPELRFLVEDDVPSIRTRVRLRGGRQVILHGLHPKPPHPSESLETTERDAELLIVGREVARSPLPAIVMGDLNDVAWSHTTRLLQRISGLLDPRIGRGLYNTYGAHVPFLVRWPVDHVFHSVHFQLVRLARLPAFGSDHFPVFAELSLEPEALEAQEEPVPDPADFTEAAAKIEAGNPATQQVTEVTRQAITPRASSCE